MLAQPLINWVARQMTDTRCSVTQLILLIYSFPTAPIALFRGLHKLFHAYQYARCCRFVHGVLGVDVFLYCSGQAGGPAALRTATPPLLQVRPPERRLLAGGGCAAGAADAAGGSHHVARVHGHLQYDGAAGEGAKGAWEPIMLSVPAVGCLYVAYTNRYCTLPSELTSMVSAGDVLVVDVCDVDICISVKWW